MSTLLGLKPLPDAVFAVNDRKAIGAMIALRRYGYKVPEHMGIVSFGNTPVSEVTTPPLSTVEQAAYEMGTKSCQLLCPHQNADYWTANGGDAEQIGDKGVEY